MIRTIKAAILACALAACAPLQTGPFVPQPAILCNADPDCPVHEHCWIPAIDAQRVCMDGDSEIDSLPPPLQGMP